MMSLVKIAPLRSGQERDFVQQFSGRHVPVSKRVARPPAQRAGPCGFRISSAVLGAMPASRPRGCAPFRAADVSEDRLPSVLAHGCPAHMVCMVARFGAHGFPDSGPAPQQRGSLRLKLVTVGARRFLENCFFRALRCTQTTRGVNEIQIAET